MQSFGEGLKIWRRKRRLSQLDLGLGANVSARHISFLETGRAGPSRSMVLQLCETLAIPRPARNQLLRAAGFAASYVHRELDAAEMAPARQAIDWMLARHAPYPAFAIDRHWTLLDANAPAQFLLQQLGITRGDNLITAYLENVSLQSAIRNFEELAVHLAMRLRTEAEHVGGDELLETAASRIAALSGANPGAASNPLPPFLPTQLNLNGLELSLLSTIAQFGSAEDIALAEIRVELLFPADEATRQLLNALPI